MPKTSLKLPTVAASFMILTSLIATIKIVEYFPPDTKAESLSAIGQIIGSLFSFWALIGLILGQYAQNISIRLQHASILAQRDALADQIETSRNMHLAFLFETTANAIALAKISLERYARSLLVSSPSLDTEKVLATVNEIPDEIETPHAHVIVELEWVRNQFEHDIDVGLLKNNAFLYINLYEEIRAKSEKLSKSAGAIDRFALEIENTSLAHLYMILKNKLTT